MKNNQRNSYNRKNTEFSSIVSEPVIDEPKVKKYPKVKVISSMLRKRKEPSTNGEILGHITDQGTYQLIDIKDDWGQLEDKSWIMLAYTDYQKI